MRAGYLNRPLLPLYLTSSVLCPSVEFRFSFPAGIIQTSAVVRRFAVIGDDAGAYDLKQFLILPYVVAKVLVRTCFVFRRSRLIGGRSSMCKVVGAASECAWMRSVIRDAGRQVTIEQLDDSSPGGGVTNALSANRKHHQSADPIPSD